MKREKVLPAVLCGCVLALCVSAGVAVYFWQESREAEAQLAEAREQNEQLETELDKLSTQLVKLEEEKTKIESDRDMFQLQYEYVTQKDNPIDHYILSPNRPTGFSTYEMNMEAWFEYAAWKEEFECALTWVEKDSGTVYEEDRQLLRDYRVAVEAQVDTMGGLTHLHAAELFSPEERWGRIGSWGGCAISYAEAEIYRRGTINLLDTYAYAMKSNYPYSFNEERRKEIIDEITTGNESVRETLEQLFPPLSQVLPD